MGYVYSQPFQLFKRQLGVPLTVYLCSWGLYPINTNFCKASMYIYIYTFPIGVPRWDFGVTSNYNYLLRLFSKSSRVRGCPPHHRGKLRRPLSSLSGFDAGAEVGFLDVRTSWEEQVTWKILHLRWGITNNYFRDLGWSMILQVGTLNKNHIFLLVARVGWPQIIA